MYAIFKNASATIGKQYFRTGRDKLWQFRNLAFAKYQVDRIIKFKVEHDIFYLV